jgi:hypothetical protein
MVTETRGDKLPQCHFGPQLIPHNMIWDRNRTVSVETGDQPLQPQKCHWILEPQDTKETFKYTL